MARRGDTKPLCHVAQMIVALSGVGLLPLSGGKSLVGLTACSGDSWRDTVQNIPMIL